MKSQISRHAAFALVSALAMVSACGGSGAVEAVALAAASPVASTQNDDALPLSLCSACGRELTRGARFCPHCGEPVSSSATPSSLASPPSPALPSPAADDSSHLPIDDCAAIFAECRDEKPAVALFALREACAALRNTPPSHARDSRLQSLSDAETSLFWRLDHVNAPCKACAGTGVLPSASTRSSTRAGTTGGGSGKKFTSLEDIAVRAPETSSANGESVKCPVCGGAGAAWRVRDRKSLKSLLALGKKDFEAAAAARPALSAWINRRKQERLAAEENAGLTAAPGALRRSSRTRDGTSSRECPTCAGTGSLPCRACSGFGKELCPNHAFHADGVAASGGSSGSLSRPVSVKSGRGFTSIEQMQLRRENGGATASARMKCPLCDRPRGSPPGAAPCPACGGSGQEACGSCGGSGEKKGRGNG